MKSTLIIAALSVATISMAFPMSHVKREVGGILMCTGANATGPCQYKVFQLDTCHQLEPPFYNNISTFAPDGESFECFPRVTDCGGICRSPTGCTFGAVDYQYEHKFNLSAIGWDSIFASFDCSMKQQQPQ